MKTQTVSNTEPGRLATAPRQFAPLEQVTKPNLTTEELAYYTNLTPQCWRVKACYDTAPEGLRPLRVCGKLAWPTAGAKKLLGVQAGFAAPLCLLALALLALTVLAAWPAIFSALDWAGFTMLGAGVISNRITPTNAQFDLSDFLEAAAAQGEIGNVIVRDSKAIFTRQEDGQTIELTETDAAHYVLGYQLRAEQEAQYAGYLASLPRNEVANAPTLDEYFSDDPERNAQPKPKCPRPPLGSLGDCLAETASHPPHGYTKISGCTESFWRDIPADNPDKSWFVMEADTACLEPAPVTIYISAGTPAATAREILKQVAKWLKEHGEELPNLTPREPEPTACDFDSSPF